MSGTSGVRRANMKIKGQVDRKNSDQYKQNKSEGFPPSQQGEQKWWVSHSPRGTVEMTLPMTRRRA